ncbi:MAG: nucleotidyltransferase domain-containing protein [archaeon]
MGQDKILEIFLMNPGKSFQLRGISRMTKIPKTSVSYRVAKLIKLKLVRKEKKEVFPSFKANSAEESFKFYKRQHALENIHESGLVRFLEDKLAPGCIILFGSFAKAEYDEKSDIDIFVQAARQDINLGLYEKRLGHNINLLFEPYLEKMSPQLMNNIVNGIKLAGFLKVK